MKLRIAFVLWFCAEPEKNETEVYCTKYVNLLYILFWFLYWLTYLVVLCKLSR